MYQQHTFYVLLWTRVPCFCFHVLAFLWRTKEIYEKHQTVVGLGRDCNVSWIGNNPLLPHCDRQRELENIVLFFLYQQRNLCASTFYWPCLGSGNGRRQVECLSFSEKLLEVPVIVRMPLLFLMRQGRQTVSSLKALPPTLLHLIYWIKNSLFSALISWI